MARLSVSGQPNICVWCQGPVPPEPQETVLGPHGGGLCMPAQLLTRRQVPELGRLGGQPVGVGLEDVQGAQEVQGARPGRDRLGVAPARDLDGRDGIVGLDDQALGLMREERCCYSLERETTVIDASTCFRRNKKTSFISKIVHLCSRVLR